MVRSATTTTSCATTYHLNWAGLAISALAVAAYLAIASLVTSRVMVAGRGVRAADGSDLAMLRNVVEEMSIASGVPVPQAFVLDGAALNAYAVSDGRRHGAVVVTSGLLAVLDRRELSGVVAHELAHIRNRDSRVLLVAVYAVGAIVVMATVAVTMSNAMGRAARGTGKSLGCLIGLMAVSFFLLAAVFRLVAVPAALLIRAALSRRREELADASAVQYTRDPGGLRRALEKVAAGSSTPQVGVLARALCIEQTEPSTTPSGVLGRWMGSHPPIEQRIAWLRSLEAASGV